MAKGFWVTRDGPKICWVTRDCTQIIRVMRGRTSQYDAWFAFFYKRVTRDLQDLLIGVLW